MGGKGRGAAELATIQTGKDLLSIMVVIRVMMIPAIMMMIILVVVIIMIKMIMRSKEPPIPPSLRPDLLLRANDSI